MDIEIKIESAHNKDVYTLKRSGLNSCYISWEEYGKETARIHIGATTLPEIIEGMKKLLDNPVKNT